AYSKCAYPLDVYALRNPLYTRRTYPIIARRPHVTTNGTPHMNISVQIAVPEDPQIQQLPPRLQLISALPTFTCTECGQHHNQLDWDTENDGLVYQQWKAQSAPTASNLNLNIRGEASSSSSTTTLDYYLTKDDRKWVHYLVLKELEARHPITPVQKVHPLCAYNRYVKAPNTAAQVAKILIDEWHPEDNDFIIKELEESNPGKPQLQLQQHSTLVFPEGAGLDPIFFDCRLTAMAANRIRAFAQVTRWGGILYTMGIAPTRAEQIMNGAPFDNREIDRNIPYLQFLATQNICGIYSSIKTIFNQCIYNAKLVEIPLPLPIEIFAPNDFDMRLPDELTKELLRRNQLPEIVYATDSAVFVRSALATYKYRPDTREWLTKLFVISQCKLNSGGEITTQQRLLQSPLLFQPPRGQIPQRRRYEELSIPYNNNGYTLSQVLQQEIQRIEVEIQKGTPIVLHPSPLQPNDILSEGDSFIIDSVPIKINLGNENKRMRLLGGQQQQQQQQQHIFIPLVKYFLNDLDFELKRRRNMEGADDDDEDNFDPDCAFLCTSISKEPTIRQYIEWLKDILNQRQRQQQQQQQQQPQKYCAQKEIKTAPTNAPQHLIANPSTFTFKVGKFQYQGKQQALHDRDVAGFFSRPATEPLLQEINHDTHAKFDFHGSQLASANIRPYDPEAHGRTKWSDRDNISYAMALQALSAPTIYQAIEDINQTLLIGLSDQEKNLRLLAAEKSSTLIFSVPKFIHDNLDAQRNIEFEGRRIKNKNKNKGQAHKPNQEIKGRRNPQGLFQCEMQDGDNDDDSSNAEDVELEDEGAIIREAHESISESAFLRPDEHKRQLAAKRAEVIMYHSFELEEGKISTIITPTELENITESAITQANAKCTRGQVGDATAHIYDAAKGTFQLPPSHETFQKLQAQHKVGADQAQVTQPDTVEGAPTVDEIMEKFTFDFFLKQVSLLKTGSSAGASGWKTDMVKKLCHQNKSYARLLFGHFEAMLKAQFFPSSLFVGAAIAIQKPEKAKPRPICVPEVFDKLLSKIILHLDDNAYKNGIPPTQYGVRKPWGGEKIVAIIQTAIDIQKLAIVQNPQAELIIIQTDISGAFDNVQWQQLLDTLALAKMSQIGLAYMTQYFQKQRLLHFTPVGALKIETNMGVPQGNPMSPANFSVITSALVTSIIEEKQSQFGEKGQAQSIGNYAEWIPGVFAYMDDLFIIASSRAQAESLLDVAEQELDKIHMQFNYDKCNALWVKEGAIVMEGAIKTKRGEIQAQESLQVLGIPISQSQQIRDNKFIKMATNALRAADVASLLFTQNFLNVDRFCISSRMTRLIQLSQTSDDLLLEFDQKHRRTVMNATCAFSDGDVRLINQPIKKGGLGIPALLDIQEPAIMATYYNLFKDPTIYQLLSFAGLLALQGPAPGWQDQAELMGDKKAQTGRIVEFLEKWPETQQILQRKNAKINQHTLWVDAVEDNRQIIIHDTQARDKKLGRRILYSSEGAISGAHYQCIGSNAKTRLLDTQVRDSVNDTLLSYKGDNIIKAEFERAMGPGSASQCPLCKSKWELSHPTNCHSNGPIRTTRHSMMKKLLADCFEGIPGVLVEVEKAGITQVGAAQVGANQVGAGLVGAKRKDQIIIPDITISWDTRGLPYEIQRKLMKSLGHQFAETYDCIAFDLVIKDEDAATARNQTPIILAASAENVKAKKYSDFKEHNGFPCFGICITTRGTFGPNMQEVIAFL
ncbi:MAG: hypothetical protein EZS28_023195, partial [Streblomastix strix]